MQKHLVQHELLDCNGNRLLYHFLWLCKSVNQPRNHQDGDSNFNLQLVRDQQHHLH